MASEGLLPGLYVHIPFCRTKCPYCDFYSVASSPGAVEKWLAAVQREMELYSSAFTAFDSLYLGGGTPSLLEDSQLAALMDGLKLHFTFAADTEVTIEANPDDMTPGRPAFLRDLGINRISLGVQSFEEEEVRFLGRRHTARQSMQALEWIRSSGFSNVGIDLIYGFQGQTEESWLRTLERALAFGPAHLSCYQMTIEGRTRFARMAAEGRLQRPGEEREADFFLLTSEYLEEHGFIHYEISNFARSRELMSRHNTKYWNHTPYLGLGPSAHSFRQGVRWWNVRSTREYSRRLSEGSSPVEAREPLTSEQLQLEALLLGFRTKRGVPLELLPDTPRSAAAVSDLVESGLVMLHQDRLIPTRAGFLVADSLPLRFCE